jgi:hypothetical protein
MTSGMHRLNAPNERAAILIILSAILWCLGAHAENWIVISAGFLFAFHGIYWKLEAIRRTDRLGG